MKSVVARMRAVGFTPRVAGFARRLGVSVLASALLAPAFVRFWTAWTSTRTADIRLLFDFYPAALTLLAFALMLVVVPSWCGGRSGSAASEASA